MTLGLSTAGESHGPALVAIVTGLPAGLVLDRAAIDDDLRRRQEGYGRSPRQQIETDEVEVLAGLRHGRTLGTPLALVVRNVDHKNWTWASCPCLPARLPAATGSCPRSSSCGRRCAPRARVASRASARGEVPRAPRRGPARSAAGESGRNPPAAA